MNTSSSCRIVVVSSTVDASKALARRIKALSGDNSESDSSSEVLHWTIKNKYYTAPVHFHPIHIEGLDSIELDDVPAVVYTWSEQEPFKEHIKRISEHISPYEPEVSLAINTAPTTEEELEDFFFEHGFEYVDGRNNEKRASTVESLDSSDTPGIHRAIDALSTIMWPSMVRSESIRQSKLKTGLTSGNVPDNESTELDVLQLLNPDRSDHKAQMHREMAMLEEWLNADVLDEDDDDDKGADYASLSSHAHSTNQSDTNDPWPSEARVTASTGNKEAQTRHGFDDDFTEFVAAPIKDTKAALDSDDSDYELPSKDEIRSTSARIFGPSTGLLSSSSDPFMGISSSEIRRTPSDAQDAASDPSTYLQLDDDGAARALDMDGPAFDLSSIFNALQDMKEEIARIPDEEEKRKAAARVALGLVYGLEGDEEALDNGRP